MRDEDGLYDPRPYEDTDDDWEGEAGAYAAPEPTEAYRVRSDDTWSLARDAYLAGETAGSICARFDVGLSAFWERARRGRWRRCDQPDRGPLPLDADDDIDFDADYGELAEHALRRLRRAMARGQVSAAAGWMRLHDRLTVRAREVDRKATQEAEQKTAQEAQETAQAARAAQIAETARRAETHARLDAATALALGVENLAHRLAACDLRDSAGRAAIEAELARLDAILPGDTGPRPNEPNEPNTVFTPPSPDP